MRDKSEHRRLESIPLPNTVVEALSHVPKQQCVSHSVKLDEEGKKGREIESGPVLTSANHAFYIGKLIPETKGGKVKRVLGWGKSEERIYNPEFIKGSLEYLFAHTKEGEKARVMVCRSLSEIINGSEDVEGALPTEDEVSLIKHIAKKEFGKSDDSLEVVDLETLPHHKQLFEALRSAKSGYRTDIEKVLSEESQEAVAETSSLHIARQLFKAMGESEELAERFKSAMPARIKEEETDSPSAQYYALIEVAIRLGDILNGCYIHGGSERQAIYDGIIIQLLRGEDGKYKDVEALKPLFPVLKGHRFETLYLDDKKNYHHLKKIQSTARYRLLIFTALLGSVVTGAFGLGALHERISKEKKEAEIQTKVVRERLKNVTFRFEGKWSVEEKNNPNVFKGIMDEARTHLMARYSMDDASYQQLEPFLRAYFLRQSGELSTIHGNEFELIDHIDQFVRENEIFFREKSIEVDMPYKQLWEKIKSAKGELDSEDISGYEPFIYEHGIQTTIIEPLGVFYSGAFFNEKFEFATLQHTRYGKKYLVARDFPLDPSMKMYSSKQAKLGVQQLSYAMQRFDILPLRKIQGPLFELHNAADFQKRACAEQKWPNKKPLRPDTVDFDDPITKKPFSVMVYPGYDRQENVSSRCVLAAAPEDSEFTFTRGQEVVQRYMEIYDKWYPLHSNTMPEEKSDK